MKNKQIRSEFSLIKSLKILGEVLPSNPEEVDDFEKNLKSFDIPTIPDSLNDVNEVLNRGYINKTYSTELNSSTTDDMARAAREGKDLPHHILDKMKADRNNSTKDDK